MKYKQWLSSKASYYKKLPPVTIVLFVMSTMIIPSIHAAIDLEGDDIIRAIKWLSIESNYRAVGLGLQIIFLAFVISTMSSGYRVLVCSKEKL